MDQVNGRFVAAALILLEILCGGQANAQLFSFGTGGRPGLPGAEIASEVDTARGRCGLGTLARTTSARTCQSFVDHGRTMECVANDLEDSGRQLRSAVLTEVAACYRRLGDTLVAGRGSSVDQINALEDVCHQLRYASTNVRRPLVPDPKIAASDLLMPEFSRMAVVASVSNPMQGVRLHDLPECARSFVLPPTTAARSDQGASVAAVAQGVPTVIVNQASLPAVGSGMPTNAQASEANKAAGSSANEKTASLATLVSERVSVPSPVALAVDAKDVQAPKSSSLISESAVIGALPGLSMAKPDRARKVAAKRRAAPSSATVYGYGVPASGGQNSDGRGKKAPPENASPPAMAAKTLTQEQVLSGLSAASPPGLPLTGPPPRPQLR